MICCCNESICSSRCLICTLQGILSGIFQIDASSPRPKKKLLPHMINIYAAAGRVLRQAFGGVHGRGWNRCGVLKGSPAPAGAPLRQRGPWPCPVGCCKSPPCGQSGRPGQRAACWACWEPPRPPSPAPTGTLQAASSPIEHNLLLDDTTAWSQPQMMSLAQQQITGGEALLTT